MCQCVCECVCVRARARVCVCVCVSLRPRPSPALWSTCCVLGQQSGEDDYARACMAAKPCVSECVCVSVCACVCVEGGNSKTGSRPARGINITSLALESAS